MPLLTFPRRPAIARRFPSGARLAVPGAVPGAVFGAVFGAVLAVSAPGPAAAFFGGGGVGGVVFDPSNYAKNLLTAIRTLAIIENQALQLANEARHLLTLSGDPGSDLVRRLESVGILAVEGGADAGDADATAALYDRLHPAVYSPGIDATQIAAAAAERRFQERQARRGALRVQAGVAGGIAEDVRVLDSVLDASRDAEGSLQGIQAGNRIAALSVKQALQLQGLLASQGRAETLQRARNDAERVRGQARLRRFLAGGPAWTP